MSGAASTVEEREKLVAVPVSGKRNFGAAKALPSETAAGEAELSGAALTVEEREKLVAVPVAGTRNFGAAKLCPPGLQQEKQS